MPIPQHKGHNQHQLEDVIQEGVNILAGQEKPQYTEVARKLFQTYNIHVSNQTLCNYFLGISKSPTDSHVDQQLLSPKAEGVLVSWINYLLEAGHPLSKHTIQNKAEAICGKRPSHSWTPLFLKHHPEIKLGKSSGLDPKWAQAFNHKVVENYFDLLKKVLEEKDIPWENVYNMDEKGCQWGGGQKTLARKYVIPRCR